ncbi:hypothetical protein Tco_1499965 [Tanacetum coccineum]
MRMLRLKEVARKTVRNAFGVRFLVGLCCCMDSFECYLILLGSYAFSDSLLLTPLCCDDIHDVTPRVSALAGYDRLVSEPLVIENILAMFFPTRKKSRWGTIFPTGLKRYKEPLVHRVGFDVLVGMDRLSKRKFVIVCHEKVVEVLLEGSRKLRVQKERTLGAAKALMNAKVEFRIDLVHAAMPVAKSPYRLTPLEMQELSEQLRELQDKVLELLRNENLYAKSTVKDKILATPSETSKVENAPAEMLRDLDQQMKKRADDVRGMILAAQSEAFKQENALAERLHGLDQQIERKEDENNSMEWNSGDDQLRLRWMIYLVVLADAAESVRDTIGFEYYLASSSGWTKSPVLWAEIGESSLTGPELVLDTTDKVVLIKENLKAARDRQKSYADKRCKPLEFEVGDRVLLKESPWKGVKCLADANLHVPWNEIKIDKTLRYFEELVEIMDSEVKSLKRSRILLMKVHWNKILRVKSSLEF